MTKKEVKISLHDNGYVSVSLKDFQEKVRETGSDLRARQHFLRVYSTD